VRVRCCTAASARRIAGALLLGLAPFVPAACGDTLQDKPVPHNELENLMAEPYPVFWLGGSFHGYQITEASQDPSGAATLAYGDCVEGGQSTCVTPVRVVTSPDNSFLPGSQAPHRTRSLRGVPALIAERGNAISFATGPVVVAIYTTQPRLAAQASEAVVPINAPGESGGPLPVALPDTGISRTPLPSQLPSAPRPLHPAAR
jgi:hypothetical protein